MDDALQHQRDDVAAARISSDQVVEIVLKLVATQQELAEARARVKLETGVSDLLAKQLTAAEEEIGRLSGMAVHLQNRLTVELRAARVDAERLRALLSEALEAFSDDLSDERTRDRIRRDASLL